MGFLRNTVKITAAIVAVEAVVERTLIAAPRYKGPVSDHFDGKRFRNLETGWQSEHAFLKWQATRRPTPWPRWIEAPPGPPPPRSVRDGDLRVTFVNHSTTLIQLDGINVLTDPVWSRRVSPVSFTGPRRHRPPGIRFDDLPRIDFVLVSHNHYDHLDVATLRRLQRGDAPQFVTPLGNAKLMARHGINNVTDLDWWQSAGPITAVPARHFAARGLSDRNRNLWSGFIIASPFGNVYFAGDTGWGGHFAQIGDRFAPIRLALLPIGSYLPRWFMQPAHIDPAQAVEAHLALGAATSIAVHFGTFALGDDGEKEPVWELRTAIEASRNPRFWILEHGEGRDIPPIDRSAPGHTASSTT
jgi:L-ascorbate metabolism protein UlaG (beta-lactamase superfamily)